MRLPTAIGLAGDSVGRGGSGLRSGDGRGGRGGGGFGGAKARERLLVPSGAATRVALSARMVMLRWRVELRRALERERPVSAVGTVRMTLPSGSLRVRLRREAPENQPREMLSALTVPAMRLFTWPRMKFCPWRRGGWEGGGRRGKGRGGCRGRFSTSACAICCVERWEGWICCREGWSCVASCVGPSMGLYRVAGDVCNGQQR